MKKYILYFFKTNKDSIMSYSVAQIKPLLYLQIHKYTVAKSSVAVGIEPPKFSYVE